MNDEISSRTDSTDRGITDRDAQLQLEEGTIVIYDREQTHAWIQSDTTVRTVDSADTGTNVERERYIAAVNAIRPFDGDDSDG